MTDSKDRSSRLSIHILSDVIDGLDLLFRMMDRMNKEGILTDNPEVERIRADLEDNRSKMQELRERKEGEVEE